MLHSPLRQQAKAASASAPLPDIQFDIGSFIAPKQTVDGVQVRLGPVFTLFLTARLSRTPTRTDQRMLATTLETIEARYPWSPEGLFTFVSYGIPYFNRLPGGIHGRLASRFIPRLRSDTTRLVLEEAVPGPADLDQPGIGKRRFRAPVKVERNDLLFTLRSDDQTIMRDVLEWLAGSNRLGGGSVQSPRLPLWFTSARPMFQRIGLPRKIAEENGLPYADMIHPRSPMWTGFAGQQTNAAGPAAITSFAGNASAHLTTARHGDYFDNGSIQHLSHVIQDLELFYDRTGELDQGDAEPHREHRIGHLTAPQRSPRAADGTPMYIRMDGPGFDEMDVPDGSRQPKLQFTAFGPTADFFATVRRNAASLDLARRFDVEERENGLERFLTTTRRQNFLVPPRRHRAFPLLELT